jgi:hypothetical protein
VGATRVNEERGTRGIDRVSSKRVVDHDFLCKAS